MRTSNLCLYKTFFNRQISLKVGIVLSPNCLTSESMSSQANVNRDQFVQDPAVLRERAEARRAAMQQRKG